MEGLVSVHLVRMRSKSIPFGYYTSTQSSQQLPSNDNNGVDDTAPTNGPPVRKKEFVAATDEDDRDRYRVIQKVPVRRN